MTLDQLREQANYLARENRVAEPAITNVYWFPDPEGREVRIVEVMSNIPASKEGSDLHPIYFRASPRHRLPAPSGIAMIRPTEFGKLLLPGEWGPWEKAVELKDEK